MPVFFHRNENPPKNNLTNKIVIENCQIRDPALLVLINATIIPPGDMLSFAHSNSTTISRGTVRVEFDTHTLRQQGSISAAKS